MSALRLTTAIGTPLTDDERLHEDGLRIHLADQWDAGITGILVAGSMGLMQLLRDETYRRVVEVAVTRSEGRGEIFAGAGDTGLARTRDRLQFLDGFPLEGVVVLPPFFLAFTQAELIDYYRSLAAVSRAPLYLYDLPSVTGTKLSIDTVLELAEHPNIAGIKASGEQSETRQLIDVAPDGFRVILAAPDLIDVFLRHGVRDHLDGIYAVAPQWVTAIGRCAEQNQWEEAATYQRDLSHVRRLIIKHGVAPMFSAMMNARGIPGEFAPKPFRALAPGERKILQDDPVVQKLIREHPAVAS